MCRAIEARKSCSAIDRAAQAREHIAGILESWRCGTEDERQDIAAAIAKLTRRDTFESLSEQVLAEMKGDE